MALSDVEIWVDSNGDHTCDLKLTKPWGVTYTRRKHLDGEASFLLANDDAQLVAGYVAKRRRMAIVHVASGIVLYSGRITGTEYVEVDEGDHAGMNTKFNVRDDLKDLDAVHVTPWVFYINAFQNALSSRPIDSERHMGWRDPNYFEVIADVDGGGVMKPTYYPIGYDGFSWTPATVLYSVGSQDSTPTGRNGNPHTFPTPDTKVIWSRPIVSSQHPQGDVWLHAWCGLPEEDFSGLVFHMMGDDAYEVWLNGTLLAACENDEADSAFLQTKRVVINRSKAEMGPILFFTVRCRNQGPNVAGDIGGFAMVCRIKGSTTKVIETDWYWWALDYPAAVNPASPVPGMPAGFIFWTLWKQYMRILATSGQVGYLQSWTNASLWSGPDFSFLDYDGRQFPIFADLPITNGTSLLGVLKLMETKLTWDYVPTKGLPELRMWSGEGVALIGGGVGVGRGTTLGTTIEKGVNAQNIEMADSDNGEQWNEGWANTLIYTWKNGWGEKSSAACIAGTEPRVERFYAFDADLEETEVASQVAQMLIRMGVNKRTFVITPSPLAGIIPGVNFTIDDKIPFKVQGTTFVEPVVTIIGSVDQAGNLTHTIEVGSEVDAPERKYQDFMASVAKGAEFNRGAPSSSPFYTPTYVDESQVEYSFALKEPTDTDSDTNHDTIRVQGRIMYLDIRADQAVAASVKAQVYINSVPVESLTLASGQVYTQATFNAGTTCPQGAVIYVKFTTTDTTANVTCLMRIGEFL